MPGSFTNRKDGRHMNANIKIAGTTFHLIPEGKYLKVSETYMFENVPCANTNAVLMPEPENVHDSLAVKVMVPLDDGSAFHIGYLPRECSLKPTIAQSGKSYLATIMVKNFAHNNPHYSAPWIITEVQGL